jgi:hypothetical protein
VFLGKDVLLDASALVALLDDRDQWHGEATQAWKPIARRCLTTEPAVVEAAHLVARRRDKPWKVLQFLLAFDIPVVSAHPVVHEACIPLMQQYADLPMDYADAVQVVLADRLGIRRVFTFDRKGFSRYVGARGVPFEVIP